MEGPILRFLRRRPVHALAWAQLSWCLEVNIFICFLSSSPLLIFSSFPLFIFLSFYLFIFLSFYLFLFFFFPLLSKPNSRRHHRFFQFFYYFSYFSRFGDLSRNHWHVWKQPLKLSIKQFQLFQEVITIVSQYPYYPTLP